MKAETNYSYENILGLESYEDRPELNKIHFKNGESVHTPYVTEINIALRHANNHKSQEKSKSFGYKIPY